MISDEYAAGLFDGDGSIGIYPVRCRERINWRAKAAIICVYKPVLVAMQERYRGSLNINRKRVNDVRTIWSWELCRREDLIRFLVGIRPSLMEKASQVDIALRFLRRDISGQVAYESCRAAKAYEFTA